MNKLLISPSPHVHSGDSIEKNMYGVLIALIPAFICSVVFFGMGAIIVTLTSVLACLIFEYLIQKFILKRQPTIWDGSAIITGVLLAFNVPANLPIWIILIGALVAIGIGKMSFGGLGCNIFNPALVGRVFLLISFPVQMTTWPMAQGFNTSYIDAQTGATPLALLKEAVKTGTPVNEVLNTEGFVTYKDMLLGNMGGSLGEGSCTCPASRLCLYAFSSDYYLAYSRNHFCNGCHIRRDFASVRSGTICKSIIPLADGRYDVGSYLYGNRLCNFPDEFQRHDYLWCRNWSPDYHYSCIRSLSGGYVVRYFNHECLHTID